jgi:hypothetical protein
MADSDFAIDENNLEGEHLRQAQLYHDWSKKLAEAAKSRDLIELDRKIKKAELYKDVKLRSKDSKMTVADIEAEVRTSPAYREISEKLINAEEHVALMDAGKWSINQKGKSLERLSEEKLAGFNQKTGIASQIREDRKERKREELAEVDKGLRDGMNKKKITRG